MNKIISINIFQTSLDEIMTKKDDMLIVNLGRIFGSFRPDIIASMVNLETLDICDCTKVDANEFVQEVVKCSSIRILKMNGCVQFTDQQVMQIMIALPNLYHLEWLNCAGMSANVAARVIYRCPNLRILKVKPCTSKHEDRAWRLLKSNFRNITFG